MPSGIFNPTLVFPSLSLSLSSSFSIFLFVTFSLFPFLFLFLFNFLYLFGNFALWTWSLCSLASPRTLDSPAYCMLELQNVLSISTLCSDLINNYPYIICNMCACVCIHTHISPVLFFSRARGAQGLDICTIYNVVSGSKVARPESQYSIIQHKI